METNDKPESGYVFEEDDEFGIQNGFTDIEIIKVTKSNVIARGRRYGRYWLLKCLNKEVQSSNVFRRSLQKEFEIHSRVPASGIVRVMGFENVEPLGQCIVEEWVDGSTLAEHLQSGDLSKSERRRILRDLTTAVGAIHEHGVVHRDLKPENIMIRKTGGEVVILDFGLADSEDYAELKQGAGTPGYISPEQKQNLQAKISDDIYSLGVIMKELCPEYGRLAARCTGPVGKRPKDTADLLGRLERRQKRPARVVWATVGAVVVAAAVGIGNHYYSFTREATKAQERVSALSETNHMNEQRVALLTDSLVGVKDRMERAESEIKRIDNYNAARARAYAQGCKKIDNTLKHFDKLVQPYFDNPTPEFYDQVGVLQKNLKYICETAFDPNEFPELHEDDKYKLQEELLNHYLSSFSAYYTEWQAKFYRDEHHRVWNAAHAPYAKQAPDSTKAEAAQ